MKVILQKNKEKQSNRFCQSFQSFTQISEARNKLYASTHRNSFYLKKDKNDNKLPFLSQTFASSNAKNAKQKLENIGDRLTDLENKVTQLKLQTKESRRFTNFIKQDIAGRTLSEHQYQLMQKIFTLDKYAKISKQNQEEKTTQLKQQCLKLTHFSTQLKQMLQNISQSVDTIENTMGVYSGKEKHKI